MKTKTLIRRAAALLLSLVFVSGEFVPAEAHTHTDDCYCNGKISALSYVEEIDPTCAFCHGSGKSTCESCNGVGQIANGVAECSKCNGYGYVESKRLSPTWITDIGYNSYFWLDELTTYKHWEYQYGDVIYLTFIMYYEGSSSSASCTIYGHRDYSANTNTSVSSLKKVFSSAFLDGVSLMSGSSFNFGKFQYKKADGVDSKTFNVKLKVSDPTAVMGYGFDLNVKNFYADVYCYVERTSKDTCSLCQGTGCMATTKACSACNGTGKSVCPVCEGTGKAYVCPDCGGLRYSRKNCEQCEGCGYVTKSVLGDYETKNITTWDSFCVYPKFKAGVKDVKFEFDYTTYNSGGYILPELRKSSSSRVIIDQKSKYVENLQISIQGPAYVSGSYIRQPANQTSHIVISFDFTDAGLGIVTSKYNQLYFYVSNNAKVKGSITYPHAGVSVQEITCPVCMGTCSFVDTSKPCGTCNATGTIKVDESRIYHYTCDVCGVGDYSESYYGRKCGRKLCVDTIEMEDACGHTRFSTDEYMLADIDGQVSDAVLPYTSSDGTLVIESFSYLNENQKDCGYTYHGHCVVCGEPFTVKYYWPDNLQTGRYVSSLAGVDCVVPEIVEPVSLSLNIWGETHVLDVKEETEISGLFPSTDKATNDDDIVVLFTSPETSADSSVALLLNTKDGPMTLFEALENKVVSELSYASLNVSADEAYALTEVSGILPSGSTLALRFCMVENCDGLTAYTDRDSESGTSDIVISVKKNDVHTELEWNPIQKTPEVKHTQRNVGQIITRYMTDGVLTRTSLADTPATVYIPISEYKIGSITLDDAAHFRFENNIIGGDAEIKAFIKVNSSCSDNMPTAMRIYDMDGYLRDVITLTAVLTMRTEETSSMRTVTFIIDGNGTPANVNKGSLLSAAVIPNVHIPSDLIEDHITTTYSFDGWYLNSNYTEKYDFSVPVTDDLALYGRIKSETYITPSYTVSFIVNGHEISSQTVYERECAIEPSMDEINTYVPAGSVFRKWDKSCSYITEDTVITAKFQQIISPENQLADTDGEYDCLVRASIGATYLVSIPKKIVLDGSTGLGSYRITVDADLGGMDYISVRPLPSSAEGFVLKEAGGKRDTYFSVYQPKQYFISSTTKYPEFVSHTGESVSVSNSAVSLSNDCAFETENGEGMTANATVSANITAGTWKGIITFEIFLGEKNIG